MFEKSGQIVFYYFYFSLYQPNGSKYNKIIYVQNLNLNLKLNCQLK
jgi:hypothetical protein